MLNIEEIRKDNKETKVRHAKRRHNARRKAKHRVEIYRSCSNFSVDAIEKYGGRLKKGFLCGSFHPFYERKWVEDHSNCRNRLSVAHQRALAVSESKMAEYLCA